MDVSQLHWSSLEYSLPDFAHRFHNFLPLVVKVTAGFLGKQELDSISRDMVIQVHSLQSQKRAVLETKSGRILSVPVSISSVLFYVVKQNCQCDGPLSLQAVLSSHRLPVLVQPVTPLKLPACFARCYGNQLETLTLSVTYEEKFLLGHPLDMAGSLLTQTPLVLPMYMKEVFVSLPELLNPQQQNQFSSNCVAQSSVIASLSHNRHFIFQGAPTHTDMQADQSDSFCLRRQRQEKQEKMLAFFQGFGLIWMHFQHLWPLRKMCSQNYLKSLNILCPQTTSNVQSFPCNYVQSLLDITFLEKSQLIENGDKYTEVEPIYMSLDVQEGSIALYQHLVDSSPVQEPPKPPVPLRSAKPPQ
uniref:Uncharacterized protein n=1 Tax=Paramormyrops kingsleyae TaxID=1676925 RepID=A0A3B3RI43_9TELE